MAVCDSQIEKGGGERQFAVATVNEKKEKKREARENNGRLRRSNKKGRR